MDVMVLGASISLYTHTHKEPRAKPDDPTDSRRRGPLRYRMTEWEWIEIMINVARIIFLLFLVGFYVLFVSMRYAELRRRARTTEERATPEERTHLLDDSEDEHHATNGDAATPNGTVSATTTIDGPGVVPNGTSAPPATASPHGTPAHDADPPAPAGWERPTSMPQRNWWEYLRGYSVLFPYVWPSKDRRLQVLVVLSLLVVALQRGLNLLVPRQVGIVVDVLAGEDGPVRMPWFALATYVFLRLLQGGSGLLSSIRSMLWIPVSQFSYREISVAAFEHVHSLDLDFHLGKKTGEVVSALGKGASINTFLDNVTFQVIPMIIDLTVAIGYFLIAFDSYYALVLSIVTFWYIYITIRLAKWRGDVRRAMTNADREEDAVKNDSMVSYETVKYFNAEPWEFARYRKAVDNYLFYEWQVTYSLNYLNVCQNAIFTLGLMAVCFIAAYQITTGQRRVGQITQLLIYMSQLQAPLNFFGTFYRVIQNAMINAERMLELLKLRPSVVDGPDVSELETCKGKISFDNVRFSYNSRKPALTGLSFECPAGTTTALVGESGGGKSTVFRLLFRFYNAESGSIAIDNNDVQDISINSLRQHIGVVPQDTILFNDTLMYNLRYANQDATDEEVYAACRAASIHDRIMGFPDQYETQVGERGLRLSGGEKQRVAIARTIIKNPRIIMLDEATAALDTETEEHIQEAFDTLGRGRTMLVIAHRLSTITTADKIVVLHAGSVAEEGTHTELLAKKGRYASMWKKQVRAQKAAEEAAAITEAAGEGSGEQSENDAR